MKATNFAHKAINWFWRRRAMIFSRSTLMLLLQNSSIRSQVFSQLKHIHFFRCNSASSSSLGLGLFSLPRPHHRQAKVFGTAVAAVAERNGRDTFFAEENVSWHSLGLSDTISKALSNVGLERPSFVQVPVSYAQASFGNFDFGPTLWLPLIEIYGLNYLHVMFMMWTGKPSRRLVPTAESIFAIPVVEFSWLHQ